MSVTVNYVHFTAQGSLGYSIATQQQAGKCRISLSIPKINLDNNSSSARFAWYKITDGDGRTVRNLTYKKLNGGAGGSFGATTHIVTVDKQPSAYTMTFYIKVYATTTSSPPSGAGDTLDSVTATIPKLASVTITYKLTIDGTDETIKTEAKTENSPAKYAKLSDCDYFDDDAVLCHRFNSWLVGSDAHMPDEAYRVGWSNQTIKADICPPLCVKDKDRGWLLGCPYVKHNGIWVKPTDIKGKVDGEWIAARRDIISL